MLKQRTLLLGGKGGGSGTSGRGGGGRGDGGSSSTNSKCRNKGNNLKPGFFDLPVEDIKNINQDSFRVGQYGRTTITWKKDFVECQKSDQHNAGIVGGVADKVEESLGGAARDKYLRDVGYEPDDFPRKYPPNYPGNGANPSRGAGGGSGGGGRGYNN